MPKQRGAAVTVTEPEHRDDDEAVEAVEAPSSKTQPGRRGAPLSKTGVLYFGHVPEGFFEQTRSTS